MKRKIVVLLFIIIVLIIAISPSKVFAVSELQGDINRDLIVNERDLLLMLRHMAASNSDKNSEWILNEEQYNSAELTGNGILNNGDLLVMLRYLAAKENPETIGKMHSEWIEAVENNESSSDDELDEEIIKEINPRIIKLGISSGAIQGNTIEVNKMEEYEEGGIQLNKTELEMKINEVCKLEAVLDPEIDGKDEIEWETNNKDVVEIYSGGMIVGKNEGEAIITVKVGNRKAKCRVNVVARGEEVNRIVLDKKELEIEVGEKGKIGVTVEPASAKNKDIRYRIGNNEIAEVDENGIITGKRTGTTSLMVMAGKRSEICVVKVKEKKPFIERIELNKKNIEISEGNTTSLAIEIIPENAINREIEIESNNDNIRTDKSVVEVGEDGKAEINITGRKAGESEIIITAGDIKESCRVKIKDAEIKELKLDNTEIVMQENQLRRITANIEPREVEGKEITWKTSNKEVAEVDNNGLVKGKKEGESIITATSGDKSANCKIKVEKTKLAVLGLALSTNSVEIQEEKTAKLTVSIAPKEASNKEVNIHLDNDNASINGEKVIVDEDGKAEIEITGKKAGKSVLTATSGSVSSKCTITVKPKTIAVSKVTLSKSNLTLDKGKTAKLTIKIEPTNATNKEITIKSNNSNASVSKTKVTAGSNGTAEVTITAKKAGEATITATSGGKSANCKAKINAVVELISLSEKNISLEVGKTRQIKATITPSNVVNKKISWTSSDSKVVTVDQNGNITARGEGTAKVTAKSSNGKTTTATVKVMSNYPFPSDYIEHMKQKVIFFDYKDSNSSSANGHHTNYACMIDTDLCRLTIFKKVNGKWELAKANINGKTEYCAWNSIQGVNNSSRNGEGLNWFGPRSRSYKTATRIVEKHAICPYGWGCKWISEYVGPNPKYGLPDTSGTHSYQRFEYAPTRGDPTNIPLNKRFLSQGCCVLKESAAKWIYDNVPNDSTVVIFDKYNPLPKWYVWDTGQNRVIAYSPRNDVPNSIKISQSKLELNKGNSKKLSVSINPSNASHRGVSWGSSNSSVATVDSTGKVTAKSKGTANITVKVLGLTSTCKVTVK